MKLKDLPQSTRATIFEVRNALRVVMPNGSCQKVYTNVFKDGSKYRIKFYNIRASWASKQDGTVAKLVSKVRRVLRDQGQKGTVKTVSGFGPYYCTSIVVHLEL